MVREPGRQVSGAGAPACLLPLFFLLLHSAAAQPQAPSPLAARGYTVLPEPRSVALSSADFRYGPDWRIEVGSGVSPSDVAVQCLQEELVTRFHMQLQPQGGAGVVRLLIEPGSVTIGQAQGRDKSALAEQAYQMDLSPTEVRITANASTGLFYGVETLVQLLKPVNGALQLPAGRIADWPDLQFRAIYWDDAYHLDQPGYLMNALRQAAFFKINALVINLEGHFAYKSAPAAVEPYAFSPAEFQQLTAYGLRYHIQLIPFLDGPARVAFLLKHPEYAALREVPNSNYELCAANPDSSQLLAGMYQDLHDANRGVSYFFLPADQPYYIGKVNNSQCQEADRAQQLGGPGKLLDEFLSKTAGVLHALGRTVLFLGDGARGTIYVPTLGEETMFPDYFTLPESEMVHAGRAATPRIEDGIRKIASDPARQQGDAMGAVVAARAGAGLHTETFWLGYAAIAAAAWNPGAGAKESMAAFYPLYYGPQTVNMDRVYELMSRQAQLYADSWDTVPSKVRKPILGDSHGLYDAPRPANDQSVPLPPPPSGKDLTRDSTWARDNARRLLLASAALTENTELLGLLDRDTPLASGYPQYGLSVFHTIAQLCRQNLNTISDLGRIDTLLDFAQENARDGLPQDAVGAVDQALSIAVAIRASRNAVLNEAIYTWDRTWYPRGGVVNGRRFLHDLDDIEDHLADRTADMSYLVYRELILPFGEWFGQVQSARNQYAQAHGLDARRLLFDWSDAGGR